MSSYSFSNNNLYWYVETSLTDIHFVLVEKGAEGLNLTLDLEAPNDNDSEKIHRISVADAMEMGFFENLKEQRVIKHGVFRGVELHSEALEVFKNYVENPDSVGFRHVNRLKPGVGGTEPEGTRWYDAYLKEISFTVDHEMGSPEHIFFELAWLMDYYGLPVKNLPYQIRNLFGTSRYRL